MSDVNELPPLPVLDDLPAGEPGNPPQPTHIVDDAGIVHHDPLDGVQPPAINYKPEDKPRGYIDRETGEMKFVNMPEPTVEKKQGQTATPENQPATTDDSLVGEIPTGEPAPADATKPNPFVRMVGEHEFDLSPENFEKNIDAYNAARDAENAKSRVENDTHQRITQSNDDGWAQYLQSDPYLKSLGLTDATAFTKQLENNGDTVVLKALSDQAMNVYRQFGVQDYLNTDGTIKDEYIGDTTAENAIEQYRQALSAHHNYKAAAEYTKRLLGVKQAHEIIAGQIDTQNASVSNFWKQFAPLTGIPLEEWMRGTESDNYRVRDVTRDIMNNPNVWKTYDFYGQPRSVIIKPDAIREAYEMRYGKIPVAAKAANGVSAIQKPVHSAAPASTVVSPTGSNTLSGQELRNAITTSNGFDSLDTDERRDQVALHVLRGNRDAQKAKGYAEKLPLHISRWVDERGLSLKR